MAYLKSHTDLPVAVGFGIKTSKMAATISRNADAAVVGSAIVDRVLDGLDENGVPGPGTAQNVLDFVRELADGERKMSWLTNFVRPKIRALVKRKDVPDNLWTKCDSCGQMIFHRDLQTNLHVCQNCGHHMRIPLAERLAMLFDEGKFTRIDLPDVVGDPLKFRDDKRYSDRLKEAPIRPARLMPQSSRTASWTASISSLPV